MSTRNDTGHWRDWLPELPAPVPVPEEPVDDEHSERPRAETGSTATDVPRIGRGRRTPSRSAAMRRHAVLAGASLALAATVGGLACLWPGWNHPRPSGADSAGSSIHPTTVASAPGDAALGGEPGCEPVRSPNLVRGNGSGSLDDGPDAILAFEHAYYAVRSGVAARAVTTADAAVPSAQAIDTGIATVAPGTTACVAIIPQATDRYQVSITETDPHGAVHSFTQLITTTTSGSGTDVRITGINAADS